MFIPQPFCFVVDFLFLIMILKGWLMTLTWYLGFRGPPWACAHFEGCDSPHRWSHIPQPQRCDWHRSPPHFVDENRWTWCGGWLILLVQNGHYFTTQKMTFFKCFFWRPKNCIIFAQGCGGRCGCASRVCPQLSPIIHFPLRFVLLTCPKIAEMGWTQTWAPKAPGWSMCQQTASPSASVSHKTSNLFGRQMTWLSLASRGPLRVRRILFSSWGSQCRSRGAERPFWSEMWL